MAATLRTVDLVGANGDRRTLVCDDTGPYDLRPDSGIWGMTTYTINARRSVGGVGERVDDVKPQPRTFRVPILVKGDTENAVDALLGDLARILDPTSDIRLVYTRPDGSRREIVCRYLAGGENLAVPHADKRFIIVPLVFRAFHPYWRDVTDDGQVATEPFLDASVGASNPIYLFNRGDVDVWPEITLTGPLENIEAASLTTGQVVRIVRVMAAGETIKIDTNPESRRVWINEFPDFPGTVDPFSSFWPLIPGWNNIVMRAISPGNAGSWHIKYRPEFDTC